MKPIKLGIIGPGIFFWKRHFPVLLQLKYYFQITAVLNHSGKKNPQLPPEILQTNNPQEFYSKGNFEAVDILSPIPCHYQHIREALENGQWVMVEKPVVGSLSQAKDLEKLDEKMKARIFVAENFYYFPSVIELKKRMEQQAKPPIFTEIKNFQFLGKDNPYSATAWRVNPDHEGGILLDGGIHLVSLINFLFGKVDFYSKKLFSISGKFGVHDTFFGQFQSAKHGLGELKISYHLHDVDQAFAKVYYANQTFICFTQALKIMGSNPESLEYEDNADIKAEFLEFSSFIRKGSLLQYSLTRTLEDLKNALFIFS